MATPLTSQPLFGFQLNGVARSTPGAAAVQRFSYGWKM